MSDFSLEYRISPRVPHKSSGAHVDATKFNSMPDQSGDADRLDELALMKRLGEGDETAMTRLIELHGTALARLVGRLTAWSADHEDVFQEVLLHIWQKATSFRGQGPLGGWLRRLTINRCHNHLRQENSIRRKLAKFFDDSSAAKVIETKPQPVTTWEPLKAALAKLPFKERTALVLYYLEEMSADEVAFELGIKPETLHVRLHRARKKLKNILETSATNDGQFRTEIR
jgi:RNA polymerase sigma-70 factor (ECF subfamily)